MKRFMKKQLTFLTISIFAVGIMLASMISGSNATLASANTTPEYLLQWGALGSGDKQFNNPVGITVDVNGYIYVVDSRDDDGGNNRIQKFDSNGNLITKWWTSGTNTRQLQSAKGIAVDSSGNVYVSAMSSTGVYHILKFNQSGSFIAKLGDATTGLGHSGSGFTPFNIAIGSDGSIYAAYSGVNKIVKFSNNGAFILEWGASGSGDGQFSAPRGIAVDSNNYVYVADSYNSRVQKFDSNGSFLAKWGTRGNGDGQFTQAYGIFIDNANDVYVTSAGDGNESVQKFNSSGVFISRISNGARGSANGQFSYPEGIAVDGVKNIYVADTNNARIQKFDGKTGVGPAAYWDFNDAAGNILHDKAGSNDGTVYGATWNDGALSFNGTSSYVKVPDNSKLNSTSAITISLWIKPTTLQGIALNKELQYRLIAEDVNTSKPSARIRTANTNWGPIQGQSNLVTNSWQYVALTYNGSKWRMYYNGRLDVEVSDNGLIASSYSDDGNLYFGHIGPNRGRNNDLFFKGSIDDIRIYDRALSASEISSEYNSGRTTPPLCISWTYSEWNACSASGQQTRSIISSSPNGCIGGSPALERGCVYIPPCTTDSWQCNDWGSCSVEGKQSRTCNKTATCDGGVVSPQVEKACTYVIPICSSWTYSEWSACSADGKQIRSVMSALPLGCTGGSPVAIQSCTYTPPCTEDKWECGDWNQCTIDGRQVRSCTKTFDCRAAETPAPLTSQSCTPQKKIVPETPRQTPDIPKQSCNEDRWECGQWNQCSLDGIQRRKCTRIFDCPSVESDVPDTAQSCDAPINSKVSNEIPPPTSESPKLNRDQILRSTVKLECITSDRKHISQGSGTVIDEYGTILTNKHVISGTLGKCSVGFISDEDDSPAFSEVAYVKSISNDQSPNGDMAILKINNPYNKKFTAVDIYKGNSDSLKTSVDTIFPFGYPDEDQFGSHITVTEGPYSGKGTTVKDCNSRIVNVSNFFKTTAVVYHGNSGGGAYQKNTGYFMGIPSRGTSCYPEIPSQINYILSVNSIKRWLSRLPGTYNVSQNNYSNLANYFSTSIKIDDLSFADLKPLGDTDQSVSIYKDSQKRVLLVGEKGKYNSATPTFLISSGGNNQGYYVYFGRDKKADPQKRGKYITTEEFSPSTIKKEGLYYLIFKAKDSKGKVLPVVTVEYRYKK